MRMKQPTPISVRPRKDSDLEVVWVENDRNPAAMRELIHSWAESFKHNLEQSEKEGEQ